MRRIFSLILLVPTLASCKGVLAPAGPIANEEHIILIDSLAIMLAIVVPTVLFTLGVVWWFRASNSRANYRPTWSYSGQLELLVWSIPALVVLFLGGIAWIGSHDLDPARPLQSIQKPLEIEVVALDWKWLFIYPEQKIASLNYIAVPVNVPIHFKITSATVMNVFFVPELGSEIYAMNGMTSVLNLQADKVGIYPGLSAHFSGDGFAGMAFDLQAMPSEQFQFWSTTVQSGKRILDQDAYRKLLIQSQDEKPSTYSNVSDGLFDEIVTQKLPPGDGPPPDHSDITVSPRQER